MDESTNFDIVPLIGANPLAFGMPVWEVDRILGPADSVSTNHSGQRVEHRSFMSVGYSAGEPHLLEHIGFGRQMIGVKLSGVSLFKVAEEEALRMLGMLDGRAYGYMGVVAFLRLGIALTGFHDKDSSQKAITLFPEGAWDKRRSRLTPFAIPQIPPPP